MSQQAHTLNGSSVLKTIVVNAGETTTVYIQIVDSDGRARDIASMQLTFRLGLFGTPFRVNMTRENNGLWAAAFASDLTRPIQAGRYSYEVWATLSGGERCPVGRTGNLYVNPSVGRTST